MCACVQQVSLAHRVAHDAEERPLEKDAELSHAAGGEAVAALSRGAVLKKGGHVSTLHLWARGSKTNSVPLNHTNMDLTHPAEHTAQ